MKEQALAIWADLKAWTIKNPMKATLIGAAILIFAMGVWTGSR